jgi:hypothetical protein
VAEESLALSERRFFVYTLPMSLAIAERESDVPLVQTIWRAQSERASTFSSVAVSRWELVVTKLEGRTTLSVRGPETRATQAIIPPDGEFFGIPFEHGAFMPHLLPGDLLDTAITLPSAGARSFWLKGRAWQFPTFENADVFVRRLVREGVLVHDPAVGDVVRRYPPKAFSTRTLRRRCVRATGLTPGLIRQIDRARQATALLQRGVSILDTINETGFFDQPHLTRALRRFMGRTPAEILRANGFVDMSLWYKTHEFDGRY